MTISLYVNTSEKEKLDKSLSNKTELNGYLKQGSSVVNPIITIQITNPSQYNYVYIPQFHRYYFITDTVNVRNNIWELHMHVDTLSSFKTQIRANKAIIESIEKKYTNTYINQNWDDKIENRRFNHVIMFPNGFNDTDNEIDWTKILITAGDFSK